MPSGTSNRSGVHQREVEQFRSGEPGSPPLDADETTSINLEIIAAANRTSFERPRDRIASSSGSLKRVSTWSAGLGGIVGGVDMQACARLPIECLEISAVGLGAFDLGHSGWMHPVLADQAGDEGNVSCRPGASTSARGEAAAEGALVAPAQPAIDPAVAPGFVQRLVIGQAGGPGRVLLGENQPHPGRAVVVAAEPLPPCPRVGNGLVPIGRRSSSSGLRIIDWGSVEFSSHRGPVADRSAVEPPLPRQRRRRCRTRSLGHRRTRRGPAQRSDRRGVP